MTKKDEAFCTWRDNLARQIARHLTLQGEMYLRTAFNTAYETGYNDCYTELKDRLVGGMSSMRHPLDMD
jgi:hypothetical protein